MSHKMTHEQMVAVLNTIGLPSVARHLEALHRENIELRKQALGVREHGRLADDQIRHLVVPASSDVDVV